MSRSGGIFGMWIMLVAMVAMFYGLLCEANRFVCPAPGRILERTFEAMR